ncbi:efflux RND transporter periplasmic adaptor subunit [Ferruginivarius sediminum]|uniref:Efflux RND transporter periplasmic adaptor subunit n=1 Tax=Ferruginivarius sediminum TaxID=2661937 RepID=A0A369TD66_9PROT|nr:efflux RND transporter periplasmic adaptor subunit [Ferruginivarius sediminum]RDD62474.1 efflux RND transporter periplasmic adaptor subunit [Ferruginivarius sediminum]
MRLRFAGLLSLLALAAGPAASAPAPALSCIVKPQRTVELGAQVAGILDELVVERGDAVEEGDVVARLRRDVEEVNVELNRVRAASTAEIRRRELELANKKNVLARKKKLKKGDYVSAEDLEEARVEMEVAQQMLREARDNRRMARIELQRAETMLNLRILKSPISGVVTESHLSPGEFVSEQKPIMTITDVDPLHVEVYLPLSRYGKIEVGERATVELQSPIGGRHPATVTVVDSVIDAASGTFGVRLELPNPEGAIPAGLRCGIDFGGEGDLAGE